ncbi:EXLDI protein [Nocardia sp. GCM10030253]|uniref:EXLDI protein n=1 Tax=Nocardia sp. GCM10030253 TaxID=3273404 RepID=UPI00363D3A81
MSTDTRQLSSTADVSSEEQSAASGIDLQKGAAGEFGEVVLKVGPGGARQQRFFGRLVGESRQYSKVAIETVRVYLSRKGKYVVQVHRSEWSDLAESTDWFKDWKNWKNWRGMVGADELSWGDFTVEVVDSLEQLRDRVPEKIYRTLVDVAAHPYSQDLDV